MAAGGRGQVFKMLFTKLSERSEDVKSKVDRSNIFTQMGGQNF